MGKRRQSEHWVTQYARAVVDGRIPAGRLVRLAGERHLRDVEKGAERGLHFDQRAATRAIEFFGFLFLAEGEHAGKPFKLEPFEQFIVGSLFGWKGSDGYRRFRTAYVEIGKGNGKSPLAAGIGLYGLNVDGERGAEIYSSAVTQNQAKIVFADAEKMVSASPALSRRITKTVNNLAVVQTNSFFRPVSSEARGLDGKRVHIALIDEIHEHPNSLVVDKMRAGTKGRRQALIVEITNSGYDRNSVCWQHHDYSAKVLEGIIEDDSWFAYVCQLDPCEECRQQGKTQPVDGCTNCDQWTDENVWLKANPCLDVSVTRKYLREQVREAVGMPAKQNIVKRLNFCMWTEQAERWIDMAIWDEGAHVVDAAQLKGRKCFGGLDLSSTTDVTAFVVVFPPEEEKEQWKVLCRFWIPKDNIQKRVHRDRVPYDQWIREGLLEATEGNVVDYAVLHKRIGKDGERFAVREIAFDRWNATQLSTQLAEEGFEMVPFGQGFGSMAGPTKEVEKLIIGRQIAHGGNPVLRWMMSNVSVKQDPAGNLKPDKSKSSERIDGVVSLVMAVGRAVVHQGTDPEYQVLFV
jgi:phage terminase large subunit-like protein